MSEQRKSFLRQRKSRLGKIPEMEQSDAQILNQPLEGLDPLSGSKVNAKGKKPVKKGLRRASKKNELLGLSSIGGNVARPSISNRQKKNLRSLAKKHDLERKKRRKQSSLLKKQGILIMIIFY